MLKRKRLTKAFKSIQSIPLKINSLNQKKMPQKTMMLQNRKK